MMIINKPIPWVFGVALGFSSATQLRFVQGVVGLSEILFAFTIILSVIKVIKLGSKVRTEFGVMLCFSLVFFFLLTLGFLSAQLFDFQVHGVGHDVLSYLFVASLLCVVFQMSRFELETALSVSIFVGVVFLGGIFVLAQFYSNIAGVDFWLDHRFKGWSNNPNQLGLYFSSLPFFILYFIFRENSDFRKLSYVSVLPISIFLGYSSYSDALYLAWGLALSSLLMLVLIGKFQLISTNYRNFLLKILILMVLFLVFVLLFFLRYESLCIAAQVLFEAENNQGAVRFALWKNALSVIFEFPFIGWGPGAHSGLDYPHNNYEAHNTFLDLGASTGFLGLLLLFWVVFLLVIKLWKNRNKILLAGMVALIVVSMFHHYLRHPLYWFYLVTPFLLANPMRLYCTYRPNE